MKNLQKWIIMKQFFVINNNRHFYSTYLSTIPQLRVQYTLLQ